MAPPVQDHFNLSARPEVIETTEGMQAQIAKAQWLICLQFIFTL